MEIIYFGIIRALFGWGAVEERLEEQVTCCDIFTSWIKTHKYQQGILSASGTETSMQTVCSLG